LDQLAKSLLEDDSDDQKSSRLATESFTYYVATVPTEEQRTIEKLKVPARDSHTGIEADATFGEAVKDTLGTSVCIHKTGDFLVQAVRYLST